ncbi:MAG: hypothetical protein J4224_02330 [Candidatus Diapherotrites archaeon]|uniref:Uncharacterized protein n=1 Tax=Candidatus Iainarchaeum sp. TaxID=3101447 RepID=A0A7J4IRY5_9ARCH|nr:MAG: hypothetical protein QT03_C0001G0074 [archaeon GW2011_AR10]MBS3059242.1 hypothetical protein [Candidatus Diapherotrites archaeon]HIH08281.1 hypothetical protein [Candidatus Diapherotrites archaeon]
MPVRPSPKRASSLKELKASIPDKFKRQFPHVSTRIELWLNHQPREFLGTRDRRRIFWEVVNFGTPFLREFGERQTKDLRRYSYTLGNYESPVTISSSTNSVKVSLSFSRYKKNKILKIEGLQGVRTASVTRQDFYAVMREMISIAKSSGYNVIYFIKPEKHPYYDEDVLDLRTFYRQKMRRKGEDLDKLSAEGRPTLFELRELQEEHQERMRKLYYGIATAFKFNRKTKGKYMELKI